MRFDDVRKPKLHDEKNVPRLRICVLGPPQVGKTGKSQNFASQFLKVHFHELLLLLGNRCSFALLRCLVCVDLGNSPLPLWDAKKFIRLPLQSSHTHRRGHRRARKVGSGITNSFCLTHLVFTRPVACFVFLVWLLIIRNFGFRKPTRNSYCYGFLRNFAQHPIHVLLIFSLQLLSC